MVLWLLAASLFTSIIGGSGINCGQVNFSYHAYRFLSLRSSTIFPNCHNVNIVNSTLAFAWINWFVEAHLQGFELLIFWQVFRHDCVPPDPLSRVLREKREEEHGDGTATTDRYCQPSRHKPRGFAKNRLGGNGSCLGSWRHCQRYARGRPLYSSQGFCRPA